MKEQDGKRVRHAGQRGTKKRRSLVYAIAGLLFLAVGMLLLWASGHVAGFADWYVRTVYPHLVGGLGGLCGQVPFSVVELLLYFFCMFWLILLAGGVAGVVRRRPQAGRRLGRWMTALFCFCSLLFFLYAANCGVNYHAASFSERCGLRREGYEEDELETVSWILTLELIALSSEVSRSANGQILRGEDWPREAADLMQEMGEIYQPLAADYPVPKPVLVSRILSVQDVTGVYSPFTIEANYNREMPVYNIPFTMCHELSHLSGFMREDEANFIGWLACRRSEDAAFRYSSAMLGWIHCTNELGRYDPEAVRTLSGMLPEEVRQELQINNAFWSRYEGAASRAHEQINDSYLKANGQADGVRSYERMVELVVSYFRERGELSG